MQTQIQKNPDPGSTILVARIIWAAMLLTVGTFYFVAQMDESKRAEPVNLSYNEIFANQTIQMIFVQALVMAALSFFLPKFVARKGQGTNKIQKGFVGLIIRLALAESVSIFGLVSYYMVFTTMVMHPFLAISVLLILISFPTQDLLEDFAS